MPFTIASRNIMLDAIARGTAPATSISHVGALDADPGKAATAVAATDIFTSTAHGYAAGDLVVFSGLTGGAGLVAGRPYFVIAANLAANTFQVAETVGGTSVNMTSDLTAATVTRLVEITGGTPAYARKAIAYAVAAGGISDDSTNGAILDIPASATVDYLGYWSAVTAGTLHAITPQTPESFALQGTYTVTDSKHDLLATGAS